MNMNEKHNLLELSKILFNDKERWQEINDEEKSQFFFIFNRYFSRRFPHLSQLLNDKMINKSLGFDLWFHLFKNKPYPQWFWPKNKKTSNQDADLLLMEELRKLNHLTKQEIDFISINFPNELGEELNYLKLQKNGNTTKKMVHSKGTK